MKKTKEENLEAPEDSKGKKSHIAEDKSKSRKGENISEKEWQKLAAKNQSMEQEIDELQKKLEENNDFILRLRADFDNYRKRMLEEKERITSQAGEKIFKNFLKIYDSYTKALEAQACDETTRAFLEGFRLIKQEMDKFLEEEKVEISTRIGDEFDPTIHQAILFEEKEDAAKEQVMEIFQHGYLLNGRPLREAMVKVAKPKTDPVEDSPGSEEKSL